MVPETRRCPRAARYAHAVDVEKLWRYGSLARLWAWALLATAALQLALAVIVEASSEEGLAGSWLGVVLGIGLATAILGYLVVRVIIAAPSSRLRHAEPNGGPRRLEAAPGDWRRWAVVTVVVLFAGGSAMLIFLIGVLERGGVAEAVVVGLLTAWGLATLEDAYRIEWIEQEEGRRYYALCRRPTAVGRHLVWEPVPERVVVPAGSGATIPPGV
jgi:hypothetical protein